MAKKKDSYCITHPGRLATSRCKQCHKPLCNECAKNFGEDGLFCSDKCHVVYARFVTRAQSMPYRKGGSFAGLMGKVLGLLKLCLIVAVAIVVLMITGNKFGVGLKHAPNKKPIPLEPVFPKQSPGAPAQAP